MTYSVFITACIVAILATAGFLVSIKWLITGQRPLLVEPGVNLLSTMTFSALWAILASIAATWSVSNAIRDQAVIRMSAYAMPIVTVLVVVIVFHDRLVPGWIEANDPSSVKGDSVISRLIPVCIAAPLVAIAIAVLSVLGTMDRQNAPPSAGDYGQTLIEREKDVLERLSVPTPEVQTKSADGVGMPGDVVSERVAAEASDSFRDPNIAARQNHSAMENANKASGVTGNEPADLSAEAERILRTRADGKQVHPEITDPIQRVFRNLAPLREPNVKDNLPSADGPPK